MMKFSENFNKSFHLRMSFNLNTINYEITRARIKIKKINDIIVKMKKLLIFDR